ncbi:E3 ubiquitin-protein ligase MPSR1 [Linum perenne]
MASDADSPDLAAVYNRLLERHRNLSLVVPYIYGLATPTGETPEQLNPLHDSDQSNSASPSGQGTALTNRAPRDLDTVFMDFLLETRRNGGGGFRGLPPASKASIEAMPSVEIGAECGIGECVICLGEWVEGEVVKEMPCKHRFHGSCVEKWLGIHGSCPVCRYQMPVEELNKKSDDEEGRRRVGRDLFGSFSFGGSSSRAADSSSSSNSDQAIPSTDSNGSGSDSEIRD